MNINPARRRFLLSVLVGLLAGRTLTACDAPTPKLPAAAQAPPWLSKITGERDAVARIGNAYLALYPDERNLDVLLGAIEKSLPGGLASPDRGADPAATIVTALQRAVRSDYQRNAVVRVEGWILSRTEARLYGAVAMLPAA